MAIVKFGDIVRDVKINVDRANNPYEHYVAGDHMDSEDLTLHRYGNFATDDVGPAFTRIFKPGQVLYGSRRTYLKKIAVANFEGICANTTFVLESKDDSLFDNRLLPFIMLSDAFTRWSIAHSKGSTNPYVLFSDLADYEFDLPPIAEQKVLADKLWAAYRLKESYKKLLAATEEMVKSRFIGMFKDVRESKSLCAICRPKQWPTIPTKDFTDDGYLVYGANGIIGHYSQYNHEHSTILMACRGASCGAINISQPKSYITGNAMCMDDIDDNVLFDYLAYFLSNYDYKTIITGGAQPQITVTNLQKVMVPIAPKSQQEAFGVIVKQADKSKFELRESIKSTDKVIKSLINII